MMLYISTLASAAIMVIGCRVFDANTLDLYREARSRIVSDSLLLQDLGFRNSAMGVFVSDTVKCFNGSFEFMPVLDRYYRGASSDQAFYDCRTRVDLEIGALSTSQNSSLVVNFFQIDSVTNRKYKTVTAFVYNSEGGAKTLYDDLNPPVAYACFIIFDSSNRFVDIVRDRMEF